MGRKETMKENITYSPTERRWLWTVAALGFLGVNGTFLYGFFFVPGAMSEAMTNPVSMAFLAEALILLALLAYLLGRWGVNRLGRVWFVVLSALGSMAFALPAVLLWPSGGTDGEA
jgi:hypothetical protein